MLIWNSFNILYITNKKIFNTKDMKTILIIIIIVVLILTIEYGSLYNWLVDNLTYEQRLYLIYLIYKYRFFKRLLKAFLKVFYVNVNHPRVNSRGSLFKYYESQISLKIHEEMSEIWSYSYPKDLITINSSPDKIVFVNNLAIFKLPKFHEDMKIIKKSRKLQKYTDFWLDSINSTEFRLNLIEILSQLQPGNYNLLFYIFSSTRGKKMEDNKVYNYISTSDLKFSLSQSGFVNNVKFYIHVKDGMLSNEEIMYHSRFMIFKLANFIKQIYNIRYDLKKDSILIIERKNTIQKDTIQKDKDTIQTDHK